MQDARPPDSGAQPADGAWIEVILNDLERELAEQLSLARRPGAAQDPRAHERIARLLGAARQRIGGDRRCHRDRLRRIRRLRRELLLTLAQRKDELSRRIARLHAGKKLLGAYGPNR